MSSWVPGDARVAPLRGPILRLRQNQNIRIRTQNRLIRLKRTSMPFWGSTGASSLFTDLPKSRLHLRLWPTRNREEAPVLVGSGFQVRESRMNHKTPPLTGQSVSGIGCVLARTGEDRGLRVGASTHPTSSSRNQAGPFEAIAPIRQASIAPIRGLPWFVPFHFDSRGP